MIHLTPHNGIPRHILLMMAVMAGFTVANLYYNQPLLDMICRETGIVSARAVSGYVGEWMGWRAMFFIVAGLMLAGLIVTLRMMPQVTLTFQGTYRQLLLSAYERFIMKPTN